MKEFRILFRILTFFREEVFAFSPGVCQLRIFSKKSEL